MHLNPLMTLVRTEAVQEVQPQGALLGGDKVGAGGAGAGGVGAVGFACSTLMQLLLSRKLEMEFLDGWLKPFAPPLIVGSIMNSKLLVVGSCVEPAL
mmetsp:Transcript_13782/g.22825  ORF Transcript_13782/g.22825 Transcript_13782/m.22825 type:complete len:97 (-) Transcript_13782:1452-1742(-)